VILSDWWEMVELEHGFVVTWLSEPDERKGAPETVTAWFDERDDADEYIARMCADPGSFLGSYRLYDCATAEQLAARAVETDVEE
jgi:hypothetical protein